MYIYIQSRIYTYISSKLRKILQKSTVSWIKYNKIIVCYFIQENIYIF